MSHVKIYLLEIAYVAYSKRYQRLDDILIIFTRTIQEISKVVCKKTMSKTRAFIVSLCWMKCEHYSKRMLRKKDCVKFRRAYCLTECFFFFVLFCFVLFCFVLFCFFVCLFVCFVLFCLFVCLLGCLFVCLFFYLFFGKQLCWFLRSSAGKKNKDFVQPLVAFPISNTSYHSNSVF